MSTSDALQISARQAGAALTPPQKRFNTLIRQIAQARKTLAAWQDGVAMYRQADAKVVVPLQAQLRAARRDWIFALGAVVEQRGWSPAQQRDLRRLLCWWAATLLEAGEDDPPLKALHDQHAEVDFDTERREIARTMKQFAEEMTGLDLGDDEGILTDDDVRDRVQRAQREAAERAAAQDVHDERSEKPRRPRTAAQQRRDAEAQQARQSVREIYRKLASALHPDRETDAAQRDAKTALMQRVNQAYDRQDLLALLELQLQIEQIDESHIAGASAQRLKHYNQVLAEQLDELKAEVDRVEMDFRMEFGVDPPRRIDPSQLGQVLEHEGMEIRARLAEVQREMRMFDDPAATKRWLKRQRQELRAGAFDLPML